MNLNLKTVLLFLAFLLFVLGALGVGGTRFDRFGFVSAGLAVWVLTQLIAGGS
jgi:hypothetical protein